METEPRNQYLVFVPDEPPQARPRAVVVPRCEVRPVISEPAAAPRKPPARPKRNLRRWIRPIGAVVLILAVGAAVALRPPTVPEAPALSTYQSLVLEIRSFELRGSELVFQVDPEWADREWYEREDDLLGLLEATGPLLYDRIVVESDRRFLGAMTDVEDFEWSEGLEPDLLADGAAP